MNPRRGIALRALGHAFLVLRRVLTVAALLGTGALNAAGQQPAPEVLECNELETFNPSDLSWGAPVRGPFTFEWRDAAGRVIAGITATDQCDPSPSLVVSSTGPFPAGDTIVTVVATDAAGLRSEATVTVQVPAPVAVAPDAPRSTPAPTRAAPPPAAVPVVPSQPGASVPAAPPPVAVKSINWWLWGALAALAVIVLLSLASMRKTPEAGASDVESRPHVDTGTHSVIYPDGFAPRFEVRIQPTVDAGEQQVDLPSDMRPTS